MTHPSKPSLAPEQPPTLEALRKERDRIIAIFKKHGASNIRVFGSVARDEAGPDSDIDFLSSIKMLLEESPATTKVDLPSLNKKACSFMAAKRQLSIVE